MQLAKNLSFERRLLSNVGRLFLCLIEMREARSSQWRKAAGLPHSSFHVARSQLLELGLIEICGESGPHDNRERSYRPAPAALIQVEQDLAEFLDRVRANMSAKEWA